MTLLFKCVLFYLKIFFIFYSIIAQYVRLRMANKWIGLNFYLINGLVGLVHLNFLYDKDNLVGHLNLNAGVNHAQIPIPGTLLNGSPTSVS